MKVIYDYCGKNLYEIIYTVMGVKGKFHKYMIFSSIESLTKYLESWDAVDVEIKLIDNDISIGLESIE